MIKPFDLFDLCKKKEARAQRVLYDLCKARLLGLTRRYTRSLEEAQDVLQESFIKIFLRFDQLESSDKMESWMKTVVVHTAINHFHRSKNQQWMMVREEDTPAQNQQYYNPDHFNDEYLVACVNELPDGCRVVFNLYAIEGYSHREIADMLKVSEGTSRSQYHHAKELLKRKLKCSNLVHY